MYADFACKAMPVQDKSQLECYIAQYGYAAIVHTLVRQAVADADLARAAGNYKAMHSCTKLAAALLDAHTVTPN